MYNSRIRYHMLSCMTKVPYNITKLPYNITKCQISYTNFIIYLYVFIYKYTYMYNSHIVCHMHSHMANLLFHVSTCSLMFPIMGWVYCELHWLHLLMHSVVLLPLLPWILLLLSSSELRHHQLLGLTRFLNLNANAEAAIDCAYRIIKVCTRMFRTLRQLKLSLDC